MPYRQSFELETIFMSYKDLIIIIGPFLSAIIGGYITYFFAIKQRKNEAILKYKEERYAKLLLLLKGFVGETASGELKKDFFDERYKSWLYCSDEVIIAINKMIECVRNSPEKNEGNKIIGDIVLAMRKDMIGKTKLTYGDFIFYNVVT